MKYTVEKANKFIEENRHTVNSLYRPRVHFSAPIGWINDPNGFVFYRGEYHLFYQHYPYDAVWGPMHWGHAKSKDLVHWEHLPVALAPDQEYDRDGCFSGSAIEKDGKLWLMYTGNIQEDGVGRQIHNMAVSEDGITFEKIKQNPVLTEKDLPIGFDSADFRDPKIFERDGKYYSVIVARHIDNVGCVLLYSSDDLIDWQYESVFLKGTKEQGEMWECPDYFNLDGEDIILMSPMRFPRKDLSHHNLNTTVVVKGKVDWEKKEFIPSSWEELDHGHDFYAPQTLEDDQGRRIMIAWMHTWGRKNVTKDLGHGWAFSMTIPRVLNWSEGQLIQTPFLKDSLITEEEICGSNKRQAKQIIVKPMTITDFEVRIGDRKDYVTVKYSVAEHAVYLDRQGLKLQLVGEETAHVEMRGLRVKEKSLNQLKIILDNNSVELIVNEGSGTLSSNLYFDKESDVALEVLNGEIEINTYIINVS